MQISNLTADDLCGLIYRGARTPARLDTVRTALNKLEKENLVKQGGITHTGHRGWKFNGTRADHTGEREKLLRKRMRLARAPRLVKG